MKKFLCAIAVVSAIFIASAGNASAQIGHFGVVGGMTFSKANFDEVKNMNYTGFHAGVTYQLNLPLGFSIQPELLYQQRGTKYNDATRGAGRTAVGFIELPVNVQWGPDLVLFRPYIELSPYVGYAVMKHWLERYVEQTEISVWLFLLIYAAAAAVVSVSIASRVWQAARQNPAEVIKENK